MNICLVSTEYPPETGWGGIGTHVYELAHGLVRQGHTVVVLARAIGEATTYDDEGITVYRVNLHKIFQGRLLWRINKYWDTYNFSVALKMREIIKKHSIQIIEAPEARGEAFFFSFLPGFGRCGLVVKLHAGTRLTLKFNNMRARLKDRITIFMEKSSVRRAHMVVSPSLSLIGLNRLPDGYLSKKQTATVLRNAIHAERFRLLHSEHRSFPYRDYVLYVGRIEVRKGIKTLFQSAVPIIEKFPGISFIFIGNDCGLKDAFLSGLSEAHKNRVHFLDQVKREELPAFYWNAKLCVFPSRWENFPYTCLEAMASGAAVIGSKSGGMAEMIDDGISGLLVSPDNPEELKEKIALLLKDNELRHSIGINALRKVQENFDAAFVVRDTLRLYQQVIDR